MTSPALDQIPLTKLKGIGPALKRNFISSASTTFRISYFIYLCAMKIEPDFIKSARSELMSRFSYRVKLFLAIFIWSSSSLHCVVQDELALSVCAFFILVLPRKILWQREICFVATVRPEEAEPEWKSTTRNTKF
ncbi:MAG: hypothetical protein CM1200mP40_15700 [Gammaproteobacteria bacterium]|nr:MAG: hypothetical protein CM1200mP40_15700 [Gammaproteobacteria bacterium]